jgi:hypothetical protein
MKKTKKTKKTTEELYAECDRQLGVLLGQAGFRRVEAGEYLRNAADGEDRVLVDPDERKGRFAVLLSYYPAALRVVEELSDYSSEPRGFPCGPYLSPSSVGRREYLWPYMSQPSLQSSLDSVEDALKSHGLPWLEELRDSKRFAAEVDKVAALYAAFAHERAGDAGTAKRLYEEMYRRLTEGLKLGVTEAEFLRTAGKKYIFVAKKLGVNDEQVERFQRLLGSKSDIAPLDRS